MEPGRRRFAGAGWLFGPGRSVEVRCPRARVRMFFVWRKQAPEAGTKGSSQPAAHAASSSHPVSEAASLIIGARASCWQNACFGWRGTDFSDHQPRERPVTADLK